LGYTFEGWHANQEWDDHDEPVTEIPPATSASTGDREFYAEWKITTYYISYQPNVEGINYGDENPPDYTVEELPLTLVDPPESGDFYFDGWYDDAGCNNPADTTITTENLGSKTFHAKWKPRAPIAPIQLQALPSNPQLESVTVTVGDGNPPTFEVDTEYTDATYAWYWDGELIDEEIEASYTLANYGLPDVGTHELSVVVSAEGGRKLSARCLVAIMAEQGDEE
jgi:uncharacterized repeat protein (TIGR02543 family)